MSNSAVLFTVWLLAAILPFSTYAQFSRGPVIAAGQSRAHVLQNANEAPIVLEGRVVARRGFWDPKHQMILTANRIEVYTLFKGRPVLAHKKYLEVITLGGVVGDDVVGFKDMDEVNLALDAIGLFFLTPYAANSIGPALNEADYLQAASGRTSFWRYSGSPWTGADNAAHVPEKGLYIDIPAAIQAPLITAYGCPRVLVPGFDAARFASHNPFPRGQRTGPPAKQKRLAD